MDKSNYNIYTNIENLLFNSITSNASEAFYAKDLNSRFITLSKYHLNYFGLNSIEEALGKTDFDFFTKEHAQEAYDDEQEIIRTKKPILAKVEKETWKDDYVSYVITSKYPLLDNNGDVIGTWGHTINVASTNSTTGPIKQKLVKTDGFEDHLDQASKIDPLTKLKNIKSFYEQMNLFYQSAMNTMNMPSTIHCLMLIDVSNYSIINVTHGQEVAEQSIQSVASFLKKLQSSQFNAFRYSGDRFAVLTESPSYEKAIHIAKSLIQEIKEIPIAGSHDMNIEVNIGLSQFREKLPLGNIYDIIDLTDKRLYASQKLLKTSLIYDDSY